ncbi:MAG: hypothetical protein IJ375_04090 [Oscillospiraceae bacterium]|nr:hypothetical protein [Oscillospiraceae bacterium]
MQFLAVLIIAALVFGVCFLFDKAFDKAFRSKAQHKSGLAVRLSKRYAAFGAIMIALGAAALLAGLDGSVVLIAGGLLILVTGAALVVYYATFGIFYDADSFILTTFGKKSTTYSFRDIRCQRLYLIQGGSVVVELHMVDGRSVSLQSTMEGSYPFLDVAFAGWCRQTGKKPEDCGFYDPSQHCWFPDMEET